MSGSNNGERVFQPVPSPPNEVNHTRLPFYNPDDTTTKHRRNLPHWQQGETWAFVTWRLGDSLPRALLDHWKEERAIWLRHHPKPWDEIIEFEYHERFSRRIDDWLDEGRGACLLKDPENARIVVNALRHFDGERVEIASFVVMPNHVHVLFRLLGKHALEAVVKSWKGFTAKAINKRMGSTGPLWQAEYWDRLIRSEGHFLNVVAYIRENPKGARVFQPVYESAAVAAVDEGECEGRGTGKKTRSPVRKGARVFLPVFWFGGTG